MNFYSKFINELHISLKPFHTLLHDDVSFEWIPDLDELLSKLNSPFLKMENLLFLIPLIHLIEPLMPP